jgi:hypothetical protein
MTSTHRSARRQTLTRKLTMALALVAAAGVIGVPAARAAKEPAKLDVVEEMAGALGYANSDSPGFWEELTKVKGEERQALKEKAEAERAEQAKQFIADAAKYGRRTETTFGRVTSFTELIPPADGDIVDGVINIRTGIEEVMRDGTKRVITSYLKPNSVDKLGVVVSEVKDGVETVTKVIEFEPGSIDVKPGDTRPVPPGGSSSVGKKPHTIDPKADGSFGRASGNQPDEPAEVEDTDKGEQSDDGSTRAVHEPINLPDGSVITPFEEVKPDASPFRSGYDLERPAFDGAFVRITAYFDKDGRIEAVLGTVLKDGLETVVTTQEYKPGSLGGLKPGDTRPVDPSGGKKPGTWDPPKPPSGSAAGAQSGGTQSSGGAPQSGSDAGTKDGRPQSEPKDSSPSDAAPAGDPPKQDTGSDDGWHKLDDQHHESKDKDGSSYVVDMYQQGDGARDENTVYKDVATYTDSDGKSTTTTSCYSEKGGSQDCPAGLTDEPTCGSSCDHLAVLLWLVGGCTGTECGTPPVTGRDSHCASDTNSDTASSGSGGYSRHSESSGVNAAPHCTAGSRPGGPIDSGDPNDPNAPEPLDSSQFTDPHNDGVTDPADPGEGDNGPAPVALVDDGTRTPDLGGELRDPVAPWIDVSGPSGDGPPTASGDADRRIP